MIVYIIIALIVAIGTGICIFLALREDKQNEKHEPDGVQENTTKHSKVRDIIITIILMAVFSIATSTLGDIYGGPPSFVRKILEVTGIWIAPTPIPESVAIPTPTPEPTPYSDPTFVPYESESYNYKIEYPSEFSPEHGVDNMDNDLHFSSEDRRSDLRVVARFIESTELPYDYTIDNFKSTYGGTEIYTADEMESDGWYVTSRKTVDQIYVYRKCIFTNGIVRMYTFSFPVEQEDKYLDKFNYVSYIENSFRKLH